MDIARDQFDRVLSPVLHYANKMPPGYFYWLWPYHIPLGALTLLVGDPGLGKSLLAADLAARLTNGAPWPDGIWLPDPQLAAFPAFNHQYPAGSVLFASPEDRADTTILPRLAAAGANLDHVAFLSGATPTSSLDPLIPRSLDPSSLDPLIPRSLNPLIPTPLQLPAHLPLLAEAIRAQRETRLVILDPLHVLLAPGAYASPDAVTQLINGLSDLAHSYGLAILAVCHLVKVRSPRVLCRVRGSLSLVAAARSVLMVSPHPTDPHARVLAPLKCIYGAPPPPLTFRIVAPHPSELAPDAPILQAPAPHLVWNNSVDKPGDTSNAHTIPADLLDLPPDAHVALADACTWLTDYLAAGPRPLAELLRDSRAVAVSLTTLRRAKRLLSVYSYKSTVTGPWYWSLAQRPDIQDDQLGRAQK